MSVLDDQEREALLETLPKPKAKEVHPVALLGDETRVRSQLSAVEIAAESYAVRLSSVLTRERKRPTTVLSDLPTLLTKNEKTERLTAPGLSCLVQTLAANGAAGEAVLLLSPEIVFEMVERAFGGSGAAAAQAMLRPFSRLEQSVAAKFATKVAEDIGQAGEGVWPGLRLLSVITRSEHAHAALGSGGVVALQWRCKGADGLGPPIVTLLLPAGSVESNSQKRADAHVTAESQQRIAQTLASTQVRLVFELGQAELSLNDLLQLQPGQVIRLDRSSHDSLRVMVAGERLLEGTPVAEGQHVAFRVNGWCS